MVTVAKVADVVGVFFRFERVRLRRAVGLFAHAAHSHLFLVRQFADRAEGHALLAHVRVRQSLSGHLAVRLLRVLLAGAGQAAAFVGSLLLLGYFSGDREVGIISSHCVHDLVKI